MEEESDVMVFRLPVEKSTDTEGFSDNRSTTDSYKRSEKSTESDKSMMGEVKPLFTEKERLEKSTEKENADNSMEEDTAPGVGAKRKMEFEEEEEEDLGYYDSSDDPDCSEEETVTVTPIDQEVEQYSDPDPELYDSDGDPIPDSEITMWMEADPRSDEQKNKLMPKIKRYIYSLKQSKGYDCTHFPGFIRGLTHLFPCDDVIADRDRHPEGYNHLFYLASLAIQDYNEKSGTKFKVLAVEKTMSSIAMGRNYKITFTAVYEGVKTTFRAGVWHDTVHMSISVCSCEAKPNSQIPLAEKELSDKPIGNEEPDLVTIISKLNSCSNEQLMDLIKNTEKDKNMLLKYVRKYFDSIIKSQGFKCTHYPGDIPGLTYLKPRLKILVECNRYAVGYNHAGLMAQVAMDHYYRDETKKCSSYMGRLSYYRCMLKKVVALNLWKKSRNYIYYITFVAMEVYQDEEAERKHVHNYKETTLEAIVQDNQDHIDPIYCGPARFI